MAACEANQFPVTASYSGVTGGGATLAQACQALDINLGFEFQTAWVAEDYGPPPVYVCEVGNHNGYIDNAVMQEGVCEPAPSSPSGTGTFITCSTACTVKLEHDFSTGNPFVLSVADGAAMGFLIIGVWVSGLVIRMLIKAVRTPDAE